MAVLVPAVTYENDDPYKSGRSAAMAKVVFLGVSTAQSRINTQFKTFGAVLGFSAELVGVDLPIGASGEAYRAFLDSIQHDNSVAGALVTSHKTALFRAGRHLFTSLSADATKLEEVGAIRRTAEGMTGQASDPRAVRRALEIILKSQPPFERRDVLIFGAGGAGLALAYVLGKDVDDEPSGSITLVESDANRYSAVRIILEHLNLQREITLICNGSSGDDILERSSPGTLVVNASGLGKDAPGSPISDAAEFPSDSIAWDFNYRGSLEFLSQARSQRGERQIFVVDGFDYYIAGWTEVLSYIFNITPSEENHTRLRSLITQ